MTYLGYPATTGLQTIDYRLVDSTTDPYGADDFATEKLLRVEPCFLCYRPPSAMPAVNVRPQGPITFVSFTNLLKISTPLLALWVRVLNAVPGSRLLMKHFSLQEQEVRAELARRLHGLGLSPDRIDLRPPLDQREDHLAAYHEADICLDTAPYNGTTTIFESLLMGVPVVTLSGRLHAGRVTESIIRNVGLSDLVALNEDEYVAKAAALAADHARRAELRQTLRERLLQSPLCDEPGHARRMVDTLYRAWASIGVVTEAPASTVMPRATVHA
jgi:predicted O-linked N-acetylglucosamine transferase (SPINDLY family)